MVTFYNAPCLPPFLYDQCKIVCNGGEYYCTFPFVETTFGCMVAWCTVHIGGSMADAQVVYALVMHTVLDDFFYVLYKMIVECKEKMSLY